MIKEKVKKVLSRIQAFCKIRNLSTKPKNKVHFYVARNNDGNLNVFFNKPSRNYDLKKWRQYDFSKHGNGKYKWESTRIVEGNYFNDLGLNLDDFKDLKWENEPIEVFLNLED